MTVAPAEENCCHEMIKKGKKKICAKHVCLVSTLSTIFFQFKIVALKSFVQSIVKSQNESSSSGGSATALNSENSVSDWVKSKIHMLNDVDMP